ncbi:hypothetical protein Aduo_012739 [Ancylostoma duodenale]
MQPHYDTESAMDATSCAASSSSVPLQQGSSDVRSEARPKASSTRSANVVNFDPGAPCSSRQADPVPPVRRDPGNAPNILPPPPQPVGPVPVSRRRQRSPTFDLSNIERRVPAPAQPPRCGPLPERTPEGFWHHLIGLHPWARYVRPRPLNRHALSPRQITNNILVDTYKHLPNLAYMSTKFVRSLFPRIPPDARTIRTMLPFIELPTLEDAIRFREDSQEVAVTLAREVAPVPLERNMAPKGQRSSLLYPPIRQGKRPVLYQIAAINPNNFVLEAKDFFVFQPDRLELHCILLDRFSFNIENNTYGYDRTLISVKDFMWVYDVIPTITAINRPELCLERARIPRTVAMETNNDFFFRAGNFVFVTPPVWSEINLGVVLSVTRRGEQVNNFRMALEGAPDVVTITRSLCRFQWPEFTKMNSYEPDVGRMSPRQCGFPNRRSPLKLKTPCASWSATSSLPTPMSVSYQWK